MISTVLIATLSGCMQTISAIDDTLATAICGDMQSQLAARYVVAAPVHLRTGLSTRYPIIQVLQPKRAVTVVKRQGYWSHIRVGREIGWVSSLYLEPKPKVQRTGAV